MAPQTLAVCSVPRRVVEVKLSTVFYGGVSLAVYMYGQTMEIYNLVKAGRLFKQSVSTEDPRFPSAAELSGTVGVYYRFMHKILEEYNIQLLISLEYLSGTSAGGINAISLAKAVACGSDLSSVRSVWLKEADWNKLIFSSARQAYNQPSSKCDFGIGKYVMKRVVLRLVRKMLPGLNDQSILKQLPSGFLDYVVEQILSGSCMFDCQHFDEVLNDAILKLSLSNSQELMKGSDDEAGLKLFVTATETKSTPRRMRAPNGLYEKAGNKDVRDTSIEEAGYGRIFEFSEEDGDFAATYSQSHQVLLDPKDALLGLAARATSAFPFAFKPTRLAGHVYYSGFGAKSNLSEVEESLAAYSDQIQKREEGLDETLSRRPERDCGVKSYQENLFPERHDSSGKDKYDIDLKGLMDGGLVNNKPFEPVIKGLKKKRTSTGNVVDRRLLYLDPHPDPQTSRKRNNRQHRRAGFMEGDINDEENKLPYVQKLMKRKERKESSVLHGELEKEAQDLSSLKSPSAYSYAASLLNVYNSSTSEPVIHNMEEIDEMSQDRSHMKNTELRFVDRMAEQIHTNCHKALSPEILKEDGTWDWEQGRSRVLLGDYRKIYEAFPREIEIYSSERKADAISSLEDQLSGRSCLNCSKDDENRFYLKKFIRLFYACSKDYHDNLSLEEIVEKNPLWVEDALILAARNCSDTALSIFSMEADIESSRLRAVELLSKTIAKLRKYIRQRTAAQEKQKREGKDAGKSLSFHFFRLVAKEKQSERFEAETRTDEDFLSFVKILNSLILDVNSKATELLQEVEHKGRRLHPEVWKVLQVCLRGFWRYDLQAFGHTLEGSRGLTPVTVTPLSPENSTHILPALRHSLRENGKISFADVFLFSSDFMHFGGFFSKESRQNDLLWGHLDGVESMCKLLADVTRTQLTREAADRSILSKQELNRGDPAGVGSTLDLYAFTEAAIVEVLDEKQLSEIFDDGGEIMEYFKAVRERKKRTLSAGTTRVAPTVDRSTVT